MKSELSILYKRKNKITNQPYLHVNMHYKVKVSSYIAQYLILRISQSRPSLADLFNQTSSQLLWEASSHML